MQNFITYGNEKSQKLIDHFGVQKSTENEVREALIDVVKTGKEWSYLKELIIKEQE